MNYLGIKTELESRGLTDIPNSAAANSLNLITVTKRRPITSDWLLEFAIRTGLFAQLHMLIDDSDTPASIKYMAEGLLLLISRDGTTLCLEKEEIRNMVSEAVTGGLLTQAQSDELYERCTVIEPLYMDLGGRPLEAEDIRIARLS